MAGKLPIKLIAPIDEQRWDASFGRTQSALVAAAQQAKKQRAPGKTTAVIP